MAISVSCSNCGRVVYASEKEAGKTKPCPGCGQALAIPEDPSLQTEKPTTKDCPQCGNRLRLVRQFHGKNVRCNKCGVVLAVSAEPWQLSVVNGASVPSVGNVPTETGYLIAEDEPPSSQKTETQTSKKPRLPSGMPPLPKGMPPLPNTAVESGRVKDAGEILAGYQSGSKPSGPTVKEQLNKGVGTLKKKAIAAKIKHDINNLQTAMDGQLETLGTLTLTHRPSSVDVANEIAELSRIQDELAAKEATIDTLSRTKGSHSVVKELKSEIAERRNRQKAAMIAIGKKSANIRPEMPGAVSAYSEVDPIV